MQHRGSTMKIDQLAFYAADEQAKADIKKRFGLLEAEWIKDTASGKAKVWQNDEEYIVCELEFNRDLGIELEIIRVIHGTNVYYGGFRGKLAHVGVHLASDEPFPDWPELLKEMRTDKHTNPAVGARRYHYRIHNLGGCYVKFIKRIETNGDARPC